MRKFTSIEKGMFVLALFLIFAGIDALVRPAPVVVSYSGVKGSRAPAGGQVLTRKAARIFGVLSILSGLGVMAITLYGKPKSSVKTLRTYNADLESAHRRSSGHRNEVLNSDLCGCFYCLETFSPAEIEDWIDEHDGVGTTALCPKCSIDSVIGSRSGFKLTPDFLRKMHNYYFNTKR